MPDGRKPGKPSTPELVDKESGLSQLLNGVRAPHATLITILPKCWLAFITASAATTSSSLKVL